jgi:hypothetical protein
MKSSYILVATIALTLTACNRTPKVDTVRGETLEKSMVSPEIEVTHSGCGSVSQWIGRTCRIVRIDSTATAPSNGGSNVNRDNAYRYACMRALAQVSNWKGQRVENSRLVETTSTSNEVSNSKEQQTNAERNANVDTSVRENNNDTKWVITDIIRTNSAHFVSAMKPIREGSPVVAAQEVKCVMRWDENDSKLLNLATNVQ